jgi:para-aminobenzoate synthetase component 1
MRHSVSLPVIDEALLHLQMLHWAAANPHSAVLYGHAAPPGPVPPEWDVLAGVGAAHLLEYTAGSAFDNLMAFQAKHADWLFGCFSYDLKNETEALRSAHPDGIGFPDLVFWVPETVIGIRHGQLEIHCLRQDPRSVLSTIQAIRPATSPSIHPPIALQPRVSKEDYLRAVDAIRQHIIDGDVYELNYCQEFFAEHADINPVVVFERLMALSRAPFSAWLRVEDRYALCASPERFLKHDNSVLFSQPIKGTRRRGGTEAEDADIREALLNSEKDRAENVMIVDLVRNDLARSCVPGSVVVDELFGIYTFPTVHQMISTVRGRLRPEVHPLEALRNAFPMGSMTGAPKVMAMQLIERYERSRRGLYSGAIGYITPEGHFDFNVVIRSILYHSGNQYVSASVGGAIVYDSRPEEEYEECLVKVEALKRALGGM